MRSLTVLVKLNEVTTVPKTIPPWELPVLEAAMPQVTVHEEGHMADAVPEAETEYKRLETVYGSDAETKVSYVAFAYGVGAAGIRNLGKAISDALLESDEESGEDDDENPGDNESQPVEKPKNKGGRPRKNKGG